ncbi:MAG: hypothetical protein GY714_01490 [Desulfobacterales bacterium]|nr:hypothetical protein [Desulfobacterales bacterium]
MIYPMIDNRGIQWRFVDSRPVSQITDWATDFTPIETVNIEEINKLLDTGLFPDLKLKSELKQTIVS